jgi:hypothetical protein
MRTGAVRSPWSAAGLAAIVVAAVAGCANSSSTAAASGATASPANPLSTVQVAAKTTSGASSATGTISVQATVKPGATAAPGSTGTGDLQLAGTFAEQLRPTLLVSLDVKSLTAAGTSVPGGLSEIVTPSTVYLKSSALTQALHVSRPWLAIPLAQLGKSSGINFSQLLGGLSGNEPLAQSQLLAGATSVRQTGTGTLGGVPVTEYTGTISLDKALSSLSGSTKSQLEQQMTAAGLSTATFTVWIDGQHTVRKSVVTEAGKTVTETTTTTITSIGQPVSIAVPAGSQTAPLPSGSL